MDIVSEDATAGDLITPVSDAVKNWGKTAPREATPESEALDALKAAHAHYLSLLETSKSPSAPAKIKMLKKIKQVLQWMS